MKYTVNLNYKKISVGDDIFLIDIKEKNYGRDKPVLMVNSTTARVLELIEGHSDVEIFNILKADKDYSYSEEELRESINATIRVLCDENVISPIEKCTDKTTYIETIETIGFGAIKGPLGKRRCPLVGVVEITSLCNCNCPHCYVKGLDPQKQISTERIKEIASIFKSKGILNVTITGGEPLVHKDFKSIYLQFKQQGFLIDIFTNALLIDEEMALFLAKNPPRSLDITIYGTSNEEYKRFTGVEGGFDALCNALKLLKENGVFFSTKMILNRYNYSRLDEYNLIALKYDAPFRYNVIVGRGNNSIKDPSEIMLSSEQIIEIEKKDPIKIKVFQDLVGKCQCLPFDCNDKEGWSQYVCGAGLDKVFIGYDGKMSPCMTLRKKGLNLFEYGYDRIWDYWGDQRKKKLSNSFVLKFST